MKEFILYNPSGNPYNPEPLDKVEMYEWEADQRNANLRSEGSDLRWIKDSEILNTSDNN